METKRSWFDDGLNGVEGLKRRVGMHTDFGQCTQQNAATNYWDEGDKRRSSWGGEGINNLSLNMVSLKCLLHTQLSAKEVVDSLSLDSEITNTNTPPIHIHVALNKTPTPSPLFSLVKRRNES